MATKILPHATVINMVRQLEDLGAAVETSETGYVVKTPQGKQVMRAMIGTGGQYLTRWPDGLFDPA